jgi:hypothetical protein
LLNCEDFHVRKNHREVLLTGDALLNLAISSETNSLLLVI